MYINFGVDRKRVASAKMSGSGVEVVYIKVTNTINGADVWNKEIVQVHTDGMSERRASGFEQTFKEAEILQYIKTNCQSGIAIE